MHLFWVDTLAGAVGGAAGVLAGSPLDVARVRLQQANRVHTTLRAGLAAIARSEGLHALFRGASYPLATGVLQNAVTFQAYGWSLRALQAQQVPAASGDTLANTAATGAQQERAAPAPWQVFAAGCVAGVVQCSVTVPQELLKIRLQMQTTRRGDGGHMGALQMLRHVAARGGARALYHGAAITALRDAPSYGLYFLVYEVSAARLQRVLRSEATTELLSGGLAGTLAWASIYPIEVVKSRAQARALPAAVVWRQLRAQGAAAMWRGAGATLARAFIVNAAIFYGFNEARRMLL